MAPMAGVTDAAFRQRLRRNGCPQLFTEMVSAAALARGNRRTLEYLRVPDVGPDLGVQLFGANPEELGEAARMSVDAGFELVDLNAGCPVKKVVKGGAGAALLRDPLLLGRCLKSMRRVLPGLLSVKIRSGWDAATVNFLEVGRIAEDCGVDRLVFHARTRAQGYAGKADWAQIGQLTEAVKLPVIGNGDIGTAEEAVLRLHETGCSGVMLGRAALSMPWIFRQASELMDGMPKSPAPSPRQVGADLLLQLEDLLRWKGERAALVELRKFAAWAAKGYAGAVALRRVLQTLDSLDRLKIAIETYFVPDPADVGGAG